MVYLLFDVLTMTTQTLTAQVVHNRLPDTSLVVESFSSQQRQAQY